MRKPTLTAQQIAATYGKPLIMGEPVIVRCEYPVDGITYVGKFKAMLSPFDEPVCICPTCGCSVRHLHVAIGSNGERRVGLACIHCLNKADHGTDHRIGYSRKAAKKKAAA